MNVARPLRAPTVVTDVQPWPAVIDMLTSLLMYFLLLAFVRGNFNLESIEAALARARREAFLEVFDREFRAEITSKEVRREANLNVLRITFGQQILFALGRSDLQSRGREVLSRLARVMSELEAGEGTAQVYEHVQIEGHTDDLVMHRKVYPRDNWELSTARALEVLRYLSPGSDNPSKLRRMSANGYAETRPIGDNRDLNRRIEVRILFSGKLETPRGPER